ncbi:MAG: aspartate/glutamate racemase family protein [Alphaproteobacteria bacterium]|nr:aspartate/glutamate racemase family protein [Alphaproteobacteria bacterium]
MHIGLIGGIGPAATEFYYRGLVDHYVAADRVMDLTIVHADARQMVANLMAGDAAAQAQVFLPLVKRLQAAGADAVAVTSMGGHFCIKELEAISPLPVLNAIPALEANFVQRGLERIGLLGTRMVMESHIYGGVPTVECVIPQGDDLAAVQDDYLAMARAARVTEAQRATFFRVGRDLCEKQGAEAVVLGGTDLFLAFQGQGCGFPVIDAAEVHIEAIFRKSIED